MTKEQSKEANEIGKQLFELRVRLARFMETFPRGTANEETVRVHVLEPLREVDSKLLNLE